MGRNSFSGNSKLTIKQSGADDILAAFDYPRDKDRSAAENLQDCLAEHFIRLQATDDSGNFVFVVDDDESDSDFDFEILELLVPHLADGSFYEEDGDYLTVCEMIAGRMKQSEYVREFDDETGKEISRSLDRSLFWDEDIDDDDDDDDVEFDEDYMKLRLEESLLILPAENFPKLVHHLMGQYDGDNDVAAELQHIKESLGWHLKQKTDTTYEFELDPEAYRAEIYHPDSEFAHDNMSMFTYGSLLAPGSKLTIVDYLFIQIARITWVVKQTETDEGLVSNLHFSRDDSDRTLLVPCPHL